MTERETDAAPPLARLFAIAYRSLVDRLHERLRDQGWLDVRPAFGYVLLAARSQSVTATEVATLMGTSKQAASKLVDNMLSAGYLQQAASGEDARRRPVTLTPRGAELLETVERIYRDLERDWADAIGQDGVERLRTDLVTVLARAHGHRLPPVRPPL